MRAAGSDAILMVGFGAEALNRSFCAHSTGDAAIPAPSENHKRNEELVWLIRRLLEADENTLLAGGPWLPNSWLDEAGIRQSLNVLARKNGGTRKSCLTARLRSRALCPDHLRWFGRSL